MLSKKSDNYSKLDMMSSDNNIAIIADNLRLLGIKPETTALYIELSKYGVSSALQLAKRTKIARTQVYRHLEILQEYGLVSMEQLSYGRLFRALPLENIGGLIADREAKMNDVKKSIGSMVELMQQMADGSPRATIQHYYGLDGLKQVNWNMTKAHKEFRVFEAAHLSAHMPTLDKAFARRHRERCFIERGLTSYDLTNSSSVKMSEVEPCIPSQSFYRYIDPSILTIRFEAYIYDDVVTLLDYSKDHQMALEIHQPAFNIMMTELFNMVWTQATPLEIQID